MVARFRAHSAALKGLAALQSCQKTIGFSYKHLCLVTCSAFILGCGATFWFLLQPDLEQLYEPGAEL